RRRLGRARGAAPLCSSVPQLRLRPGRRAAVPLPACTTGRRWSIGERPEHGTARIRGGKLVYTPAKGFRGTDSLQLVGAPPRGARLRGKMALTPAPVVFEVGAAPKVVARAMGDSVTAGFGYYSNGKLMPLLSLPECRPGSVTLVDACSSNSKTLNNEAKQVEYATDYGLANNVSWAAQWANEYGVTNYENLAISGSEPVNWAPGGSLYATTKRIESEDPDYVLMTLGANPLLSEMLFGTDRMGCAIWSDLFGKYEECIEEAFEGVHLRRELESVYRDLVKKTGATIYLMQYHLSIPATALAYTTFQIAQMGDLLNREIARAATAVGSPRLRVVTPPHFNVGIDLEPLYRSSYSCSRFGYEVDGPSVQIDATQDELLVSHPLSFCSGPAQGPPWVISGDTGIHPSAAGYTQMASQVPAPK
ncbi:MAG TPA: Ig-like domain-containing protein, partial [Solirubrobacterales bacterium]|nr:Ig-like domain-containing protein [Solirubrobacterales bacterium]